MPRFITAIAAALLLSFFTATAWAEAPPALRVFASRHYHVHTNLTRTEAVPFGRHMDATFDQYQRRFRAYADRDPGPMPLYLFRTQDQYLAFLDHHGVAGEGSGGMFFVARDARGLATWTQGRGPSRTFRILQHEGFHQFAWNHFGPALPVWMNEGLAQYFEDAVILDRGMELGLADPHRMDIVRHALADDAALHLDDLLRLDQDHWLRLLRSDPQRARLLYAQSWSLVYFLIHGDNARYLRSFEVYLRQLAQGKPHEHAFADAFGYGAVRGIEDRWRSFARSQEPDAVTLAADRLDFLGTALAYKHQRDEHPPRSLPELRRDLQSRRFTLTRNVHGLTEQLEATDASLFTYTRPGGAVADFLLLESSGYDLPPRLVAPGLSPEPSLTWQRGSDGQLTHEIRYR